MSTERPILFSAPMVRAILEDRKTQTRRVVKLPHSNPLGHWEPFLFGGKGCRDSKGREISGQMTISHTRTGEVIGCPYGAPGDRLWVRETWGLHQQQFDHECHDVIYRADDQRPTVDRWRPSIYMPRWASRIDLEVTGVRVERLQDISEADARAEGAPPSHPSIDAISREFGYADFPRSWFAQLWESINGAGSWAANPWVWAVEFQVLRKARAAVPS